MCKGAPRLIPCASADLIKYSFLHFSSSYPGLFRPLKSLGLHPVHSHPWVLQPVQLFYRCAKFRG